MVGKSGPIYAIAVGNLGAIEVTLHRDQESNKSFEEAIRTFDREGAGARANLDYASLCNNYAGIVVDRN